jgi:hypothetical protein
MITLTSELIHKHKTANGGWTRAQVEALGVKWKPTPGWIKRLNGTQITCEQMTAFVEGRSITAKIAREMKANAPQETSL